MDGELTCQERAALVMHQIDQGWQPTTAMVASVTGLTVRGARHLLCRLSRVTPVYQDDDHHWRLCTRDEPAHAGKVE